MSLSQFGLAARLDKLSQVNRLRSLSGIDFSSAMQIRVGCENLVNFSSNDYLGLSAHPQVAASYKQGVDWYGSGSGASALVTGRSKAHQLLEQALAEFLGVEAVLLFSSGFAANLGVISALCSEQTCVFSDALNHASIIDAIKLSSAQKQIFAHADLTDLQAKLELMQAQNHQSTQRLIVSDHVFSMDGDSPSAEGLQKLARAHGCALMIDDAHGFALPYALSAQQADVYVATLGKALGLSGAFVAGSKQLIDFLINHARTAIYSTALAPAIAHAAIESLSVVKQSDLGERLLANIAYFKQVAGELKLKLSPSDTAIQPLIMGTEQVALQAMQQLKTKGLWVTAIRPPTVPQGSSRLRVVLSAAHTRADLDRLLSALSELSEV